MKTLLNINDASDLLTKEAILEHCGFELDESGTVKIYLDDLTERKIDVIGWTADELYEDFKLWFEDDYDDDETGWWDGEDIAEYPEEGEDFDPTVSTDYYDIDADTDYDGWP